MNSLSRLLYKYIDRFRSHTSEEQHAHYSVRTIIQLLWDEIKQNKTQIFLNTFIGVTIVLLDLLFVLCTKLTVDIATGENTAFTFASAAIFLVATIAIQIAFSYASRWIRAILGVKAQNSMQRRLFAHVLMSQWSGMEKYHSGDVINRIEKDVSQIVSFATESIPSLITVIVQFTGAFIFLFLMDKTLACVVVVLMPCFLIISKLYVKKMRSLTHKIRQSDSKAQAIIQESLQNRTVIKALEQDDSLVSRLMLVQDKLSKQVREKTKFSSISATVLSIGFAAGYLFAFLWGAHQLQAGIITYGASRIAMWHNPWLDASDNGYQMVQSLIAIGSGGLLGVGLGKSRQKFLYLPEEHNDCIFAIVCEELGLIGACVIMLIFALLIIRGFWIALHARDRFGSLLVVGIVTQIALQTFLNIAVVSGLVPATGISLPFFSYGGTALALQLFEMGIVLSVSRQIPAPKNG